MILNVKKLNNMLKLRNFSRINIISKNTFSQPQYLPKRFIPCYGHGPGPDNYIRNEWEKTQKSYMNFCLLNKIFVTIDTHPDEKIGTADNSDFEEKICAMRSHMFMEIQSRGNSINYDDMNTLMEEMEKHRKHRLGDLGEMYKHTLKKIIKYEEKIKILKSKETQLRESIENHQYKITELDDLLYLPKDLKFWNKNLNNEFLVEDNFDY